MKTYTAIFVTDAIDDNLSDCSISIEFEAMPECNADDLTKLAKVALAKNLYDMEQYLNNLPAGMIPEERLAAEAFREEQMIKELEDDGFYIKLLGIFEGRSKIARNGVEISGSCLALLSL